MEKKYYEEYHKTGAGISGFVRERKIPLNDINKALFAENYLKGKILDVGCGSGFDANYFYKKGYTIEGTDISGIVIENAKKDFPDINFFVHNFESAELNRRYDTICCFEVIEHIFDYKTFLENIKASLENEGTLIISTPNIVGLKSHIRLMLRDGTVFGVCTSDNSHVRFFSIETLKRVLMEAGFKITPIKTFSTSRIPLPNGFGGALS